MAAMPNSLLTVTLASNFGTFLLYALSCIICMVAYHKHPKFSALRHLFIPVFGLVANLACMSFYLIGPFLGYGTKMEPLLALGIAAVWACYGGIYFHPFEQEDRADYARREPLEWQCKYAGTRFRPGVRPRNSTRPQRGLSRVRTPRDVRAGGRPRMAVCTGRWVGGQDLGEVASRTAVEALLAGFHRARNGEQHGALLPRLVREANTKVFETGMASGPGRTAMATTLVTCALRFDRVVVATWEIPAAIAYAIATPKR